MKQREINQVIGQDLNRITTEEIDVLDKADPDNVNTAPTSDALVDALSLLDHLEEQKEKLESRERIQEQNRFSEKMADLITRFSGSIVFVVAHVIWFSIWILINTRGIQGIPTFDPYPFGFLTMAVSLEAIFLAAFILLSQDRQTKRDRDRDEIDFERDRLDLKVDTLLAKTIREATLKISFIERQLASMHRKLDVLTTKKLSYKKISRRIKKQKKNH